jgi:hypothetical protein
MEWVGTLGRLNHMYRQTKEEIELNRLVQGSRWLGANREDTWSRMASMADDKIPR